MVEGSHKENLGLSNLKNSHGVATFSFEFKSSMDFKLNKHIGLLYTSNRLTCNE